MKANFWQNKRVLLTGHTGFKGAWCAVYLRRLGAQVTGFSLPPEQTPSLWSLISEQTIATDNIGDLRDFASLKSAVDNSKPDIVLHMAAQALVRRSYRAPLETVSSNVMGTANLLEALRGHDNLKAILVVTSDKVYRNTDAQLPFVEGDVLGGSDPYSASKAASEIIVRSFEESFFGPDNVGVATARAGNVVGGGDWSSERLVPDIYRSFVSGEPVRLRNPNATRPWQHVLDCLRGYLMFAEALFTGSDRSESLNFGPQERQALTVAELVEAIAVAMGGEISWTSLSETEFHEKQSLFLDVAKSKNTIGWTPKLSLDETIDWTAEWYGNYANGGSAFELMQEQLENFLTRTKST